MNRQFHSSNSLPAASRQPPAAHRRRGVLILVVLSMLFLFVLIAITYVLVAMRQLSAARQFARVATTGEPPQQLLDEAMMQVLRGSANVYSPIYPHSLLETMYGPYGVTGNIASMWPNGTDTTNGQIVEFTATNPAPVDAAYYPDKSTNPNEYAAAFTQPLLTDGYLEGCVITMTSGPAKGLSSRIVRYEVQATGPNSGNPVFHVQGFRGDTGLIAPADPSSSDPNTKNPTFLVNGRAFAGAGNGWNAATGYLDAKNGDPSGSAGGDKQYALLPNPLAYNAKANTPTSTTNPSGNDYHPGSTIYQSSSGQPLYPNGMPFGGLGGANIDYSAPDYQHMAMSFTVQNNNQSQTLLPSYHRPDLINYWMSRASLTSWDPTQSDQRDLLRSIMLRPSPLDHPNFTGSNPNFAQILTPSATAIPWDVDNDGDGIPDSVWIDIGFPIEATSDGRLFKPLVAILCVDLDSRLNVNAHGTTEQIDSSKSHIQQYYDESYPAPTGSTTPSPIAAPYPCPPAGAGQPASLISLPRGLGYGPAEIDLSVVLNSKNTPTGQSEASNLMQGGTISSTTVEGRYASGGQAGPSGSPSSLAVIERFQYSDDPSGAPPSGPLTSCNTPSDFCGKMTIGVDYIGQPAYWKPTSTINELTGCPYNMDLSRNASRVGKQSSSGTSDNPFTVFDLERVLRPWDVDSSDLTGRLLNMLDQSKLTQRRPILTTDGWDPPAPGIESPPHLRSGLSMMYGRTFAKSVSELLAARIASDLKKSNPALTDQQIRTQVQTQMQYSRVLLAPELIAGLRININRPFGDGRDGNNSGVVNEPGESPNGAISSNCSWKSVNGFGTASFDLANGQDVTSDGHVDVADQRLARQLMARHLYVLARLLIDDSFLSSANNHWFDLEPAVANDNSPYGKKFDLSVRRIAQWAVNAVGFMCPDNIMIPFEYDKYPFSATDPSSGQAKGTLWAVDGIVDANPLANTNSDDRKSWRGLVWSCKAPPLLLTETLAFHDRRVADTNKDTSLKDRGDPADPSKPHDDDLDQIRIPEGSLFVELFAPQNANNTLMNSRHADGTKDDLYTYQSGQAFLDLARMAPAGSDGASNSVSYPVWRLAISQPHVSKYLSAVDPQYGQIVPAPTPRTFLDPAQPQSVPESASLDPEQSLGSPNAGSLLSPGLVTNPKDVKIERIVWFAAVKPTTQFGYAKPKGDIYYARQYFNPIVPSTPGAVPPGGYAVVGPRATTYIGSKANTPSSHIYGDPSPQRISLDFTTASGAITDPSGAANANYPKVGTQVQPAVGIVAAADKPSTWPNNDAALAPNGIGLNVSEPLPQSGQYYLPPTDMNTHVNPNLKDAYDKLDGTATGTFIDKPFEKLIPANTNTPKPIEDLPNGTSTGTTLNYRTVFLQRLANPLAPYHPVTNPYLTVDWLPVDLTVFNGEDNIDNHASWASQIATWDQDDKNPKADNVAFASRQRGIYSQHGGDGNKTGRAANVFSVWPDPKKPSLNLGGEDAKTINADASLTGLNFRHVLYSQAGPQGNGNNPNRSTLGYVNYSYGDPWGLNSSPKAPGGYIGNPLAAGVDNPAAGPTPKPFPWLTSNNRPYANPAELMLVPASHPGRLTIEFSTLPSSFSGNVYADDFEINVGFPAVHQRVPYAHLLNFYRSAPTLPNQPDTAPNLARIFEYLRTPSPFVGTQTVLDPQIFHGDWWTGGNNKPGEANGGGEPVGTMGLHPPFNFISNYRDPGRVNVNTISASTNGGNFTSDVWNAINGGAPGSSGVVGPDYTKVALSRQGYANLFTFDNQHPSMFSNPFRSASGADLVPLPGLVQKPANVTLWRNDATNTIAPLFGTASPSKDPDDRYHDWQHNAFFHYQQLTSAVNKLTTRSNVYAVWITIGYFEVTPWYGWNSSTGAANTSGTMTIDAAHRDGYQLGQELGSDTGEITRHRGFYIIDRTIPVGFQRGQDLNSDKAVLLKRFIE